MALLSRLAHCCSLFLCSGALKFAAPAQEVRKAPTTEVWISSFPRSASSTMLSMVRASAPDEDLFTLFEPCHHDDQLGSDATGADFKDAFDNFDCPRVIAKLAKCNFDGVSHLWGWSDYHSTNWEQNYTEELATASCTNAKRRVFKTVGSTNYYDPGRVLENMLWVLDQRPQMKILNLVRDPRSIMTSWKALKAFEDELAELEKHKYPFHRLSCDTMAANMKMNDPRTYTVVYEKVVMSPEKEMRDIYKFLGFEYGSDQQAWVETNFPEDSHGCPGGGTWRYSDCQGKENSIEEMNSWREVLTDEEKEAFASYEPCQRVFKAFNFPLV